MSAVADTPNGQGYDKDGEPMFERATWNDIPCSRRAAGAVVQNGFWIYGGFGVGGTTKPGDISDDLWCYRNGWHKISGKGPYPARYPSLCALTSGFFMFGGCGFNGRHMTFLNGLWHYDGSWNYVAVKKGQVPEGRYTSALVLKEQELIMFGGHSQTPEGRKVFYGDLWIFSLHNKTWQRVHGDEQGPGKRYGFGWTANGKSLYVFGGYDGNKDLGDLWALDLKTLVWKKLADRGPCPRYCPAFGIVSSSLILFGGRSKTDPKRNFSDTWIFENGWQSLKSSTGLDIPGYHSKPGYASDGTALWIFGGEGLNGHVSDLWKYDRSGWQRMQGNRSDDPILW